ncbi:MAG TPA: iron-containing redox enzyme family protein [Polyangiaceae bacterium]|jgi:thiaminase|nr:iron-containing redox enzyme family protein [Polyangiaceae bacterium]
MGSNLLCDLRREAKALVRAINSSPMLRALCDGTLGRDEYALFLTQTYHYVRHTSPLLAIAGERLKTTGCHPSLAALLSQKAGEEGGHERWALADLQAISVSEAEARASEPSAAVSAYIAWNTFTATAGSPVAFLGTAFVLEYVSAHQAGIAASNLRARSPITNISMALSFLRGHAGSDGPHLDQLAEALGRAAAPEEREAIALSARITRVLYPSFFAGGNPPTSGA